MKAARFGAVFLVMMSNLMLELLLTRIFSAITWYHFAFMAVSVALFGTTLGAVIVHLWPQRFTGADPWRVAAGAAGGWLRGALLVLLAVTLVTAAAAALAAPLLEGAPTWLRIGTSVLLLVPLGFVLGIPLATGLALSAADPAGYRALYWGVNGAASVSGSVLATMLSLTFGITVTYGAGVLAYALCAALAAVAFPAAGADTSTPTAGIAVNECR